MKKSGWGVITLVLVLIGANIWLLRGSDAKHLDRQDVTVDVADTFEK
ncbi:MAG: hypothetical protein JKY25_00160 [Robiginitomaculum sp.]|nr:hypothetical protein [Robiginitomaculum sp.]